DEDTEFENEDFSDGDDDTWSISTGRNKHTFPRKSVSKQRQMSRYQRMINHLQNEYIPEEYLHAMWGWISQNTRKRFVDRYEEQGEEGKAQSLP
ncbi:unnamed protein product, partial [Timema podura]|nr:unnamed protein product [Timema podura]